MTDFFSHHFNAGASVEAQAGAAGEALEDQGLAQGRMISQSKSYYCEQHPDHDVFFNACIFIKERTRFLQRGSHYRQVWWGDIDITLSQASLVAAADACGQDLWVTSEKYRWEGFHGKDESLGAVTVVFFKAGN
jgi:hypothetical protein